jgi:hypothetical protein
MECHFSKLRLRFIRERLTVYRRHGSQAHSSAMRLEPTARAGTEKPIDPKIAAERQSCRAAPGTETTAR